jgi:hypothetical protein
VQFRSSASRTLEVREAKALPEQSGIWEFTIDLRSELAQTTGSNVGTGDKRVKDLVNEISALKLVANYKDGYGERATAEMLALTHYSIGDKHIKVLTSTRSPKVFNSQFSCIYNLTLK